MCTYRVQKHDQDIVLGPLFNRKSFIEDSDITCKMIGARMQQKKERTREKGSNLTYSDEENIVGLK